MKYLWGSKDGHMYNMCLLEFALSPYKIFRGLSLITLADGHAQERELVETHLLLIAAYIPSSSDFSKLIAHLFQCLLSHRLFGRDMIDEFVVLQIHWHISV